MIGIESFATMRPDMNRDPVSAGILAPRSKWWPMIFAAFIVVLPL